MDYFGNLANLLNVLLSDCSIKVESPVAKLKSMYSSVSSSPSTLNCRNYTTAWLYSTRSRFQFQFRSRSRFNRWYRGIADPIRVCCKARRRQSATAAANGPERVASWTSGAYLDGENSPQKDRRKPVSLSRAVFLFRQQTQKQSKTHSCFCGSSTANPFRSPVGTTTS